MGSMLKLLRDRRGNFGVLTALIILPLVATAGLSIDFGGALLAKTQLQAAADAAAIGSLTQTSDAFTQAMALPGDGDYNISGAEAKKLFFSQDTYGLPASAINLNITIKKQSNVITSSVAYSANIPTTLLNIIGKSNLQVSGTAFSTYQTPSFLDIYMLLDNTPSMGIGATSTEMAIMRNTTGCALACHIVTPSGTESTNSNNTYMRDKQAGAIIRLDVVTQAISDTINKIKTIEIASNQVQMSAYTFGTVTNYASPVTPPLDTVSSPTTDLGAFASAASNIRLMTVPNETYNYGLTDYNIALQRMNDKITSVGSGVDSNNRQPVLVMIGDGVSDQYNTPMSSCTAKIIDSSRCIEPVRTSYCDTIKARGIKIAVLYTTYSPIPEDGGWNVNVKPWQDRIPTMMSTCASPGYYVEVTPTQGIGAAMDTLFGKIIAEPRLTQ